MTDQVRRPSAAAEDRIERQSRLLDALLAASPDSVVLFDRDGRHAYVSPGAAQALGVRPSDIVGRTPSELGLDAGLAARTEREIARVLASGEPLRGETEVETIDGRRHYDYVLSPILAPDGTVERVLATVRDVTERRAHERRAAEARDALAALVEASPLGICAVDAEGRITLWNRAAEALLGWTARELLGEHLPTTGGGADAIRRKLGLTLQKRVVRGARVAVRHRDGSEVELDMSAAPVLGAGGDVRGAMAVLQGAADDDAGAPSDSTPGLAEALALSERRLSLTLEAAEIGMWEWDVTADRISWSDGVGPLFGRERGWSPASYAETLALVHPSDRDRFDAAVRRTLERSDDYRIEHRVLHEGGEVRWVQARGHLVRSADGAPSRLLGVVTDVTDRVRREQRSDFLSEASRILSASLDPEETLRRLAGVAVLELADWCVVTVPGPGGELRRVAVAHRDPDRARWALELLERYPPRTDDQTGAAAVIRSGEPQLVARVNQEALAAAARDDEHRKALEAVGLRSIMTVPIATGTRVLGAISFVAAESGAVYSRDDVALAVELGRRAGLALDNAQLHERTRAAVEEERRKSDALRALAEAAVAISAELSVDDLLRLITDTARDIVGAHQAVTSLTVDQDWGQAITAVSLSAKYAAYRGYDEMPDGTGVYRVVCEENRTMRLTQAELEAHPGWRGFGEAADRHPPMRGWLAAPLVARDGSNLGLIQLSDRHAGDFTEDDEVMLVQLARMASVAIENARLYEERAHTAEVLQRSLLPPGLPELPGIDTAAVFLPAGERNDVGGDFYDLFEVDDGWLVVLGDVCGKGPEAAAVTSLARYTLRTAAMDRSEPARLLGVLNEAMLREGNDDRFCTAICARLRQVPGGLELRVARGGHPPAMVCRATGAVEARGAHGSLIGLFDDAEFGEETVVLEPGDAVLFTTDGVTDARVAGRLLGQDGVAGFLSVHAGAGAKEIVERIRAVLGAPGVELRDDVAAIALSLPR